MLPTARYVMEKLGGMDNIDQIKKIFPGFDGTVIVDGTHVGGMPAAGQGRAKGGIQRQEEDYHVQHRGSTPRPTGAYWE